MKELIEWVASLEERAARCYSDAAVRFGDDAELSVFLRGFAEDETWHRQAMERALELSTAERLPPAAIASDGSLKIKIESMFQNIDRVLMEEKGSRETLMGHIVEAEYSEWNDIFLYIINTLKDRHRDFSGLASKIQQHKKQMARFLKTTPEGRAHLEKIERLPDLWKERVLVVDDEAVLRLLFADILSSLAAVETAVNGIGGLKKVSERYYDVILSDVRMPAMDGIAFFREALRLDPNIGDRFLFMTGNPTEEDLTFFRENKLRYFVKPLPLLEVERAIEDIISRTRTSRP